MKLYTEEQVLRMFEVCRDSDLYEHIVTFEDILKTETPIQLPTDEEIDNAKMPVEEIRTWYERFYFKLGAQWMREQIEKQINQRL